MKSKLVLTVMMLGLLSGTSAVASAHGMDGKTGHTGGWGRQCHDGGGGAPLPADKAKFVHESMHKVFNENKPLFQQMENLHKEVHDIMAADKFDSKAYLKKAAQLDALHDKIRKNMERGMASIAGRLSPQERKAFLAAWMDRGHGHHGQWNHHGPGRHGDKGGWAQRDGHNDHPAARDDNGGSPRREDQD